VRAERPSSGLRQHLIDCGALSTLAKKLNLPDQPNFLMGSVRMKWQQSSLSLGVRKGPRTKLRSICTYQNCEVNAFEMNTCTKNIGGYHLRFPMPFKSAGNVVIKSERRSGRALLRVFRCERGSAFMIVRTSAVRRPRFNKRPGILLLHKYVEQLASNDNLAEKHGRAGAAPEEEPELLRPPNRVC
jgi:hypothetical protein